MKYLLCFCLVVFSRLSAQTYQPMTAEERFKWFGVSTYGPTSLFAAGPVTAAWRTLRNTPEEWGPHWDGFGKRYGMRLVNNSVGNGLEGSVGAIWKEDPRYFRMGQGSMRKRINEALKQTWKSRYGNGEYHFGAAKAIGIGGFAFGQKLWMPDSVTSNRVCAIRIGTSYAGRLVGNLFLEFGPDLKKLAKRGRN